ncbi:hypothetical protein GCM10025868_02170 [Angustibacter aerolatus]|uniref:Secreted protein n=1 Tax=Angustibacter aerolatus TaxID=1162965 RepID=A0ABQ6JB06_9ACTN|nr:hypothetical protein GCM10025868_02170 [Angustibacter aerolatus]
MRACTYCVLACCGRAVAQNACTLFTVPTTRHSTSLFASSPVRQRDTSLVEPGCGSLPPFRSDDGSVPVSSEMTITTSRAPPPRPPPTATPLPRPPLLTWLVSRFAFGSKVTRAA